MDGAISRAPAGVSIESFSTGAAKATGTVVVIDVFRAFTTAAIVLHDGAERIVMVDDLEAVLTPRRDGICRYCMGERGGLKLEGFDFGNSPAEVAEWDFTGMSLAQTTSNGTRGILAAKQARRIYAGALVTAQATAKAIEASGDLSIGCPLGPDRGS